MPEEPQRPRVIAQAPAKLNLALSVGPPRDDGLHPISSWMVTLDFADELAVTRLPDDYISRYAVVWHEQAPMPSTVDWPIARDLAVRAHVELERLTDRRLPISMKLTKRIPVGAGLGGGSSDAAAMLRTLDELFELGLGDADLHAVARHLGSDVPFLVRGGSAVVEGVGERIDRHGDHPEVHAVLVLPELACPTGMVYQRFDGASAQLDPERVRAEVRSEPRERTPFNDLAPAALEVAPELAGLAAELADLAEGTVHVSGSGSTLFVLGDDAMHTEALAREITQRHGVTALAVAAAPQPPSVADLV
jgi:4-diphosphocytidyl-2-C-methyl-D-erythritol kinase